MKAKRIIPMLLLLSVTLFAQSASQDPQAASKKKAAAESSSATADLANEVHELRRMMETQQQQIQQLQQAVQSRDQQITDLQHAASQTRTSAENAAATSSQNAQTVTALQSSVNDIKVANTNVATTMQEEQKRIDEMIEHPLAIHYKGITLTPGGFLAAESAWRQHATASDVNTPFTSVPFPGADAYHLSEFFGSGRQSRISLLAEGKISTAKLSGYYETDWLSAGVTSNNNQSNSYTNRMRQLWGQVKLDNGWTFTGGQQWSLVTETKVGLDNRTEALPMTIDAQYHVGFSWLRQYGFRVVKNFENKLWVGFSVENAQTTNLGGGGFNNNFLVGAPGTNGGLYNGGVQISGTGGLSPNTNYSYNYTPDFIGKVAFEPGFGHYEVFGILSNFRDRIYPVVTAPNPTPQCGVAVPTAATPPCTDARTGGGIGANARWSVMDKHVDFGLHFLGGDGVGRYGSSQLAEVTARPNGSLALIRSYQGLETLEWHSKHWDVYSNIGMEYAARTVFANPALANPLSALVGYGRPTQTGTGSCLIEPSLAASTNGTKAGFTPNSNGCNDLRDLIEGTFGFWYKVYNGPKGRIQFGPQYSYMVLNTWWNSSRLANVSTNPFAPTPHTIENMFFTSFRYYLP